MRSKRNIAATSVGAIIVILALAAANVASASALKTLAPASVSHVLDTCPPPFTVGYSCTFQPATVTTHVHTVIKKTVKQEVRRFEQTNHVIVTINMGKPISGPGCIDPTKVGRWHFHVGDSFKNADRYHKSFYDTWQSGWEICSWHLVKIGGKWYVKGIKANCKNSPIFIPVNHTLPKQKKLVMIFRTVKSFQSTYDKLSSSSTTYSCKVPFTLTYIAGKAVCFLATQIPVVVPTPPTVNCPIGTTKDSAGNCVVVSVNCPSGTFKDANGNCVAQTNTAALNCQQQAKAYPGATVSFNNDTLTCTIIQVNGNCSNITVIVGGGSPQVHQEGNCNTTSPPPPPPAPKPVVSVDTIQEFDTSNYSTTPATIAKGPVRVHVQAKAGDSLTGTCNVSKGALNQHTFQLTASGSDQVVTLTYTAPTEPGQDQVNCTVTDNTVNTQASASSNTFDIKAPQPNP